LIEKVGFTFREEASVSRERNLSEEDRSKTELVEAEG
jgi:hypothetical protein